MFLQASVSMFIQGGYLDQITLKSTSNYKISYFRNGAPFPKPLGSSGGRGEPGLWCSQRAQPDSGPWRRGWRGGEQGVFEYLLIDSSYPDTFQEKANGTLGVRGAEKRQGRLVFLPVPAFTACLLCTPFLTSIHANDGPRSEGEEHSRQHIRPMHHRRLGLSCQDLLKKRSSPCCKSGELASLVTMPGLCFSVKMFA